MNADGTPRSALTRAEILDALAGLSAALGERGATGEICLFGGNLPQFPHLRVTMPVPEYMLAMKCMAARISGTGDEASDVRDVVFLIRHLGLASAPDVLELVAQYYPQERIAVKTRYLVEGLFDEGKI